MRKILAILLICFMTSLNFAQDNCELVNKLNISTGIDNLGNLLSVGTKDPNWRLINVAPPSINGFGNPLIQVPDAYVVYDNYSTPPSSPMTWNYVSGAAPISALNSANFNVNNTNPNQPWRFNRQFCIDKTSKIKMSGNFRADDGGVLLLKDALGNILYTFLNPSSGSNAFGLDHLFTTQLTLNPGTYYVEVELSNVSNGMMGFALKCVLNNLSDEKTIKCCPKSNIISVQKMIDRNCNGKVDLGDVPGIGWSFTLQNGTYTKTIITDANGEAYFYDVPLGSYNLSEILQPGFNAFYPSNGSTSVAFNNQGNVKNIVFLNGANCFPEPEIISCCKNTMSLSSAATIPPSYPYSEGTYAVEKYNFTAPSNAPISELKVEVISFEWLDGPEDCKQCQIKSTNLGSIFGGINIGGLMIPASIQPYGNGISATSNNNEVVFSFPNGRNINSGDFLRLVYLLPPEKKLTCCQTRAKVCRKITWKDINCGYCEVYDCSTIDLKSKSELPIGFTLPNITTLYLNSRDIFANGRADGF